LVAVTKAFDSSALESGYAAGLRTFGESRVQEAAAKLPQFNRRADSSIHLIGHLQSNKVKSAVELFDLIESVDSMKLLNRIDRLAGETARVMPVYLQVNAGRDPDKFGLDPDKMAAHIPQVLAYANITVRGIMTIAPFTQDEGRLRDCFGVARSVRNEIAELVPTCADLSMGMSDDFELAIEEGATHVRLGRVLFGERPQL
jgi:hypothetical protein